MRYAIIADRGGNAAAQGMNFTDGLFPLVWEWVAHGLYWPVLLFAVWRAPWFHLRESESLNVLLGIVVAVLLLWTMEAGFAEGMRLHLLGATLLTLMFGWPFAVIGMSLVVAGVTFSGDGGWGVFAMNALVLGVFPVAVSYGIYRIADHYLPNHFFVYIFLPAFLGAGAAIGAVGLLSGGALGLAGIYSGEYIHYNFLRYLPLIMFPEAFITGMLMTLFVVYQPRWVSTFDDARYLRNH